MPSIPSLRVRALNDASYDPEGEFVLYWMVAQRRVGWNFAFDHAVDLARQYEKPVLVLEALRSGYRWASDRLHRFVLQGMADNRERLAGSSVLYYPYVEGESGQGKGLLEALARRAVAVVSDDFPCFFLPRMQASVAPRLEVRLEVVDGNGLLPLRATDRVFKRAVDFRRYLQKVLPEHLLEAPRQNPLAGPALPRLEELPQEIEERWPQATDEVLTAAPETLASFAIDHGVGPVPYDGGFETAAAALERFVADRLTDYQDDRNHVLDPVTSELSPYLHFGHISPHRIFAAVAEVEDWHPGRLGEPARGAREGWWGMSAEAEAFLDQLVTWRELSFNMAWQRDDHDRYETLPDWARETLAEHADDERPHLYSLKEFETAATHDEIWNAAQRELVAQGRIHGYLRMVWGKKILEWSASPREALEVMIELNNKYAIDGRDPNSTSGIFWCVGRYDRAWGPERPIFGKVRYMSTKSTRQKLALKPYLERYGD